MNEEQLTSYFKEVQQMTMLQLLQARAGWGSKEPEWHVVDREIARQDALSTNVRAWIAFGISVLALCVAIFAAIKPSGVSGS